jgi:hypothetical protein
MEAGVKPLTYALAAPFVATAEALVDVTVATARLGGDLLEATMEQGPYLHTVLDPLPAAAETTANEGEGYDVSSFDDVTTPVALTTSSVPSFDMLFPPLKRWRTFHNAKRTNVIPPLRCKYADSYDLNHEVWITLIKLTALFVMWITTMIIIFGCRVNLRVTLVMEDGHTHLRV